MATIFDQNNKYPRGSEWRRWDLHLHTPSSFDYSDMSVSDEDIINKISELGISAVAITDHHQIDIDRINNLQKLGRDKDILVLPGIEVRTQLEAKENIHLIAIFPESSNLEHLSNEILTKLDIKKERERGTSEDKIFCDYKESIKIIKSNSGLISIHCGEKTQGIDDVIKNDTSVKQAIKEKMVNEIDIFEIGNPGKDVSDYREKVFPDLGRSYPLVLCSDSHDIKTYYVDSKIPLWIKADLTFEGLRQIIYEPEDRVKIQEARPEEKEDYQIINAVKFGDDKFIVEEIVLSQNLTVIIGGRSTGKSILLRNIAQTIDSVQVSSRLSEVGLRDYDNPVQGFQVSWMDEQEYSKNKEEENLKKIIYIPQSYLNRLVDKKEDKTAIDDIIKNLLVQEDSIKKSFEKLENQQRGTEKELSSNINEFFFLEKDIFELENDIKSVGDKKGIEKEIKKIKSEIDILKKKAGMLAADINEYNQLLSRIEKGNSEKEKIEQDIMNLDILKEEPIFVDVDFSEFSEGISKKLSEKYDGIVEGVTENWLKEIEIESDTLRKSEKEEDNRLRELNQKIAPLVEKVKNLSAVNEKTDKLKNEEIKLSQVVKIEKLLKKKEQKFNSLISVIINNHAEFYKNIFAIKSEILKQAVISGEISFDISIEFKLDAFNKEFIELCNLKTIGQFELGLLDRYKFSGNEQLKSDVLKIIKGVLSSSLILKSGYSRQEVIRKLLQNWFVFDYKIKQNGDEISTMSPGKKSFVLLKLLIELDNSRCPILLDQPEDDLDNRSIYNDLVRFVKEKKKVRQIIIATHNPNLVVGSDAECVIVANQNGDQTKNKIYTFEYVGGSLENTFVDRTEDKILYKQGIREHVCDILEGGKIAFEQRKKKYNLY